MNYYRAIKYIYSEILDDNFDLQDDGNGFYISKWSYAQPAPNMQDLNILAQKFNDIEVIEAKLNKIVSENLDSTDWYFIRKLDSSAEIPQNILTQRENARALIDNLQEQIRDILQPVN